MTIISNVIVLTSELCLDLNIWFVGKWYKGYACILRTDTTLEFYFDSQQSLTDTLIP